MSESPNELLKNLTEQYEILDKLGEGGMGTLYKVRHRLLGELRVAKMMRAALRGDAELVARFQREAQLACQLRHPQVAQLYDFTIDRDGNACILMEFIPGLTLEELLYSGPPPLPLTLEIAIQTVQALDYLHRSQFVHRDISPDNLMLSHDAAGRPLIKLIDLGIAKALGEEAARFTATGMFLGKVRYSSPEQLEGATIAQIDGRSDLYSFAVVLFELLTGVYPIRGSSPPSWIAGHLYQPPIDFSQAGNDTQIPDALQKLTLQSLSKRPEERPQTAAEFCRQLENIQALVPLTAELEEEIYKLISTPNSAPGEPRITVAPWAGFRDLTESGSEIRGLSKERRTTPAPWSIAPPPEPTQTDRPEQPDARGGEKQEDLLEIEALITEERIDEAEARLEYHKTRFGAVPKPLTQSFEQQRQRLLLKELMAKSEQLINQEAFERALAPLQVASQIAPDDRQVSEMLRKTRASLSEQVRSNAHRKASQEIEHILNSEDLRSPQIEEATRLLTQVRTEHGDSPVLIAVEQLLQHKHRQLESNELCTAAESLLEQGHHQEALKKLVQALRFADDVTIIQTRIAEVERAQQRAERLAAKACKIREALRHGHYQPARKKLDQALQEFGRCPILAKFEEELNLLEKAPAGIPRQTQTLVKNPSSSSKPSPQSTEPPALAKSTPSKLSKGKRTAPFGSKQRVYAIVMASLFVLLGLWLGFRSLPPALNTNKPLSTQVPIATGRLVLIAIPWGQVTAMSDQEGKNFNDFIGRPTPFSVEVPPGRYSVRLGNSNFKESLSLEIDITTGQTTRAVGHFEEISTDDFLSAYGL